MVGSVRAALFMNFEPVASIFVGFLVLGQVLGALQILGAALVVCAIVAVRWVGDRRTVAAAAGDD